MTDNLNPISVAVGSLKPSILDTIYVDGQLLDLTGYTVKFRMRPVLSSALLVDADAVVVQSGSGSGIQNQGSVRYDWQPGDTDTLGDYRAWWHVVDLNDEPFDVPEFAIAIYAHSPGVTTLIGSVADSMRDHLPISIDHLADAP